MSVLVYEIRPKYVCSTLYYEVWLTKRKTSWWDFSFWMDKYVGLFNSKEEAKAAIRKLKEPREQIPYGP